MCIVSSIRVKEFYTLLIRPQKTTIFSAVSIFLMGKLKHKKGADFLYLSVMLQLSTFLLKDSEWPFWYLQELYNSKRIKLKGGWKYGTLNVEHWFLSVICFSSIINCVCFALQEKLCLFTRGWKCLRKFQWVLIKLRCFHPQVYLSSLTTHWLVQVAFWLTIHSTEVWPLTSRNSLSQFGVNQQFPVCPVLLVL